MTKISVTLKSCNYIITIEEGLFGNPSSFSPLKRDEKAMIITSKMIAPLYLYEVCCVLENVGVKIDYMILPDGEKSKNLTVLNMILTELLKKMHYRNTTLIALGGGVIGDLTGFAAAIYQRGVRFIQIPTTLLSQVDSSIGGKTSINHILGKNMIGAFYHPISVITDLNCLKTLSKRELRSGLAEVIKYGIILDRTFFFWLEGNIDALLQLESNAIKYCISHCCELKSEIISKDERENGLRTLLNFGHTFGHAIEAVMGYGSWLHGEAIAVGMVFAARISEKLGKFKKEDTQRIIELLQRTGLPVKGPYAVSARTYLPYIIRDKKMSISRSSELCLVIPITIGHSAVQDGIPKEMVINAINDCQ